MLHISFRSANLSDCMRLAGCLPERHARALAVQAHKSEMLAFEQGQNERELLAVIGLFPLEERRGRSCFELWLLNDKKYNQSSIVFSVLKKARSTLQLLPQDRRVLIQAHVAPEWKPGKRLCTMLGMRHWQNKDDGAQLWGFVNDQIS